MKCLVAWEEWIPGAEIDERRFFMVRGVVLLEEGGIHLVFRHDSVVVVVGIHRGDPILSDS